MTEIAPKKVRRTDRSLAAFLMTCRTRGIKITAQRKAIAEVIVGALTHPSAQQIHELVTQMYPRISLATVYRTMGMLRDAGMVKEHTFNEGRSHYELANRDHHDHLIDAESGAIIEFCEPEIERLQQIVAKRLGYRLTGHKLELYGVRVVGPKH